MEYFALYNLLNFYKKSLTEVLGKIDENVVQAIYSHDNSPTHRQQLPMEMAQLMHNYIKMLRDCEITNGKIKSLIRESSNSPSFSKPFPPDLISSVAVKNISINETPLEPSRSVPFKSEPKKSIKTPSKKDEPREAKRTPEASIMLKLKKAPAPDCKGGKTQTEWQLVQLPPKNSVAEKQDMGAYEEIPSGILHVGQKCFITHIESPSEFYVCKNARMAGSLDYEFQLDMDMYYYNAVNKFKTKIIAKKELGNFCGVFLSEEKQWHRVEVLDWMEQESEDILVQKIDHGAKLKCNYKNLKAIDPIFFLFPKQAIKCDLTGIHPPLQDPGDHWPEGSKDFLIKLSKMRTEFLVTFVQNNK